jgi:hypothetical protein
VPDGRLKDTVAVSTTVVGGTGDTERLHDGLTDIEALNEADTLLATVELCERDAEEDIDQDCESDGESVDD